MRVHRSPEKQKRNHSAVRAVTSNGVEMVVGYMRWFFTISYPYIITPIEDVDIPRPHEQEALNEITIEEH